MKSCIKRILVLTLACILIAVSLCGCSSKGKTLMSVDDTKMSINTYMLLLSRMKGNLASSYAFGNQAKLDSFWNTVIDASSGGTYNKYYTSIVLDNAKTYLAALALFDEMGLKLPKSTLEEIDAEIETLIMSDGNGSKANLNAKLAEYGANVDVLREAYIMEAKIALLNDTLFGVGGALIDASNYERYYKENYVRFRHVFFYFTEVVYETDVNGDDIYYSNLSDKIIAYDTSATQQIDKDGNVVKDRNGDVVYVRVDSEGKERIAYDKKGTESSPTQRNPLLDDDGKIVTRKMNTDELIALSDKVQSIIENEAREGEYALFDSLVEKYGEDEGMANYPNGYYLTENSDYDAPEVIEALFEMQDGEIRKVESDYGIHIVMKYKLDDGGYAKEENKDFFVTESGTYSFLNLLKSQLLEEKIASYKERIVVDEALLTTVDMKSVGANFNY
ncbi:MAG: hypothetical protein E7677_04070 [Ruminococcaceae bacterium]|nr:hypothetical protein [Oscillospiraceae bacterium]